MEDLSQFYIVPKVPANWKFELVGHGEKTLGDDPIFDKFGIESGWSNNAQYPDWVVPIGKLPEGERAVREKFYISESVELFAVMYLQPEGIVRASYCLDSPTLVRYDNKLKENLSGYDFHLHRLFAFSKDEVIYHVDTKSEELDIARRTLSDARFNYANPHLRLDIACKAKDQELILNELRRCIKDSGDGNYLKAWYQAQIDLIRRPEEQLGAGMPELACMLEQQGMLESLLVEQ